MSIMGKILFIFIIGLCYVTGRNVSHRDFGTLIGSKTYSAWTSKPIFQFLGVRYAESPSGTNRFKEPILAIPWPGIHNVRQYGRPCPSLKNLKNMSVDDLQEDLEDCLHMSIYTANLTGRKPVMVFIHGGAFLEGSSREHPPNYLMEKEIVLVVPQYRLGPLGFLCTESDEIPGNAGLFDILLALQWIKKYIRYFGGDPNNITIFGQSAGASIVSALLFSNTIESDLFNKAIIQSGSIFGPSTVDLFPIETAFEIAEYTDCDEIYSISNINECFMTTDVLSILQAAYTFSKHGDVNDRIRLSVNEYFNIAPENFIGGLSPTKDVTVMAGVTKHDGAFMMAKFYDFIQTNFGIDNKTFNTYNLVDVAIDFMGISDYSGFSTGLSSLSLFSAEKLIEGNLTKLLPELVDLFNTYIIKAPIMKMMQTHAQFHPEKTYLYTFDYRGEFSYFNEDSKYPYSDGVNHCDDLIYLFPYPERAANLNAKDMAIAKTMVELWTSFATYGKPQSDGLPEFAPVTNVFGPYLHINSNFTMSDNFLNEFNAVTQESDYSKTNCVFNPNYFQYTFN